jgi:hypothetical protein
LISVPHNGRDDVFGIHDISEDTSHQDTTPVAADVGLKIGDPPPKSGALKFNDLGMDQYLLIPFLGG